MRDLDELINEFMDANNNEVSIDETAAYFYALGASHQEKQMMKEAAEGEVMTSSDREWIKCSERMPEEYKNESDTIQGHREWTASEQVLAWDSMYGPRVDFTRNGKWKSEQSGGYQGQVCHGIVAWMPIPNLPTMAKED